MAKLIIHQEKVTDNQELVKICPFGAMEEKDGKLTINAACKMCRLCVKKGPEGAVEYVEDTADRVWIKRNGKELPYMWIMWTARFIRLHWNC